MKKTFYSEYAYLFGILFLALGTALMEKADFGMSMVVAPAYILHLKISESLPFFTFGMAEYCLQFVLLIVLTLAMGKFKRGYAFSFVTAVIYGTVLDLCISFVGFLTEILFLGVSGTFAFRCIVYACGMVICAVGVAFLFHTYFAPEAYELTVKEVSSKYGFSVARVKTVYDLVSLTVSVILSFCFFGLFHFEGVKLGTLITALVNGWMIGQISGYMDRRWEMKDRLKLRAHFE
ncbi:MAG TPA: hypothetical protein DCG37_08695 [Lachnospiraceae bacterium]|nr:hypothetical protein [Lachnospiraceae bacterium]